MGKLFVFGDTDVAALTSIASSLKLGVKAVSREDYNQTLGFLAGIDKTEGASFDGEVPEGSLLLFYQVEDSVMDKILAKIRKRRLDITYKAIMTPTNRMWTVRRLYAEMEREKRSYEGVG